MGFLQKVKYEIEKILFILNREQKIYGIFVFICSLFGAILEVLGVGIIMPLVQAFTDTDKLLNNSILKRVIYWLGLKEDDTTTVVVLLTLGVILIFVFKNIFFIFLSWIRIKFSCKISRELSTKMMSNYMKRGYEFFLNHNTAELTRNISGDVSGVDAIIYQLLRVLVDGLTIIMIVIYITITDWIIAGAMVIMALLCLAFIYGYFRVRMREAGKHYSEYNKIAGQYLLQALHGIKEILVMNRQEYFVKNYEIANREKQKGAIRQTVGAESPAYIIEGICVTGLLSVVCIRVVFSQQSAIELIPALSAFAVGAFRILPSLGRISSALNTAIYYIPSLERVYDNMKEIEIENGINDNIKGIGNTFSKAQFEEEICINNVSWHYQNVEKNVITDLNLVIPKGVSIALVGQSGAGKTTLADILLGLLKPQIGGVYIDGRNINDLGGSISRLMGYVPQTVYMTDDTIRNNIAFGLEAEQIDEAKVWKALEQAQLKEVVENLSQGLDTFVGDRGVRFSGGQRQRIAIARALYENPDIIIFDEATAALDVETEKAVMDSINSLQEYKTVIIIAHRLTTIKNCDKIYEIRNGKAYERKYEELIIKK